MATENKFDVVIVGAGHGGAQAAIALRQKGFGGSILMIGRESEPPYERPPLSKEYLSKTKPFERIYIRPPEFWGQKAVELMLGAEVAEVDAESHRLTLSNKKTIGYGTLIWSAGGDPRRLQCKGAQLAGVHTVRAKADVDAIMSELHEGAIDIVVIGGGYIGLEAAAVLSKLGCSVTVLEALPRVLARVAGEELSLFFEAEHRRQGVGLRTEAQVECLVGETCVTGVKLADGEIIPADMVIVGIGIEPSTKPLTEAGARGTNGVEVDEFCHTSLSDVYAIGDCAAHTNSFAGDPVIRLESVQNANDMAVTVAKAITGAAEPYAATPWFWSHQYDLKLQTVGISAGHDAAILRGNPKDRSFSVVYLRRGEVIALDCVNAVKDYVQGKKLVEARARVAPNDIEDMSRPLSELVH